jgi:hypothetical protein
LPVALVAALVATTRFVPPANAATDIAAMIANAKTAADHQAIAAYYDKEAASAKEAAAVHRKMLAAIQSQGGPAIAKWHMDTHCEQLIEQYESAAKMYTDMAAAHREMAKDVK